METIHSLNRLLGCPIPVVLRIRGRYIVYVRHVLAKAPRADVAWHGTAV